MSKFLTYLKNSNFQLPIPFGRAIALIPFSKRPGLGKIYKEQVDNIEVFQELSIQDKQEFIFDKFYKVFKHSFLNIPFYNELYQSHGLDLSDIKDYSDIKKIPIIKKSDLLNQSIDKRSYPVKNRLLVNTGGSSGKTLAFYMDPMRFGNEWAHIHYIWSKLGYRPADLKVSFDGRSNIKDLLQYDFIRNTLRFDIYSNPYDVSEKLYKFCKKYEFKYLHGYPSAIYNFAIHCEQFHPELLKILRKSLKGAFLSSEFPSPKYREMIESIFEIPTQSFYGHTETCVMAYEKEEKFKFNLLQTYGFAESEEIDGKINLIGTSYFNFASPLIRYNTEDTISVTDSNNGLLNQFRIDEGRSGDFIYDKELNKISVTGLIFGRHHRIFDLSKHIQLYQSEPGKVTILYVSNVDFPSSEIDGLFDSSNLNLEISFKSIESPILTKAGKTNVLVKKL